jgi:hypothetical protein
MCQGRGAPLLRGGALPSGAANLLRGGAPTHPHLFTFVIVCDKERGGSHHLNTWLPSSPTWCTLPLHMVHPPSLGISLLCYILKHFSHLQVSWSFGKKLLVYHCYCNTLSHFGIKEDFGGQIGGLAKCVDVYVYEVILFYCFYILVNVAL